MITRIISDLMAKAPPIDNPLVKALREEVPANATRAYLDCQVVLKSGYSMAGVMCFVDAGETLQLTAFAKTHDNKVVMATHYFDACDVLTVGVGRDLPEQLVKPARNGSPIIMGH